MAKTIAAIQTLVRIEGRDSKYSLVDTDGLAIGNAIYRRLANLIEWPELNKEDTSLTTTAGTAKYTWPTTYAYIDVTSIEVQDPYDNSKYKIVAAAPSELEWNLQRVRPNSFPELYKRSHDGTNNVITLAPAPNVSSLTIRITGQVEPTEYTLSSSTTVFLASSADDALVFLIAADIADKRGAPERAASMVSRASEILSRLAGREITPAELRSRVLSNG